MRLYDAVNNVLKRLDDYPAVSSEQLWTRAEVELYVKDGYDAFCRQTKCIFDFFYPENVPQAGNYVARWERDYFAPGMIAVGLLNYSGGYWERDYAEASDTGPINSTQPWEAEYIDTTFAVALHPVPEDNVAVDRATHDWRRLEPEFTRWLEENDRSYQTTTGTPSRFAMDRDGVSRFRVVPAGSGNATQHDVNGTYGLLRDMTALPASLGVGRIAYWKLHEESGTRDDFHASFDLTDNNSVGFAVGRDGNAALFVRASSQYLSLAANGSDLYPQGDFSIAGWIYPTGTGVGTVPHAVVAKMSGSGTDRPYGIWWYPNFNLVRCQIFGSDGGVTGVDLSEATPNTWHHFVFTYKRSDKKVRGWLNGGDETVSSTAATADPPTTGSCNFAIGGTYETGSPDRFFDGRIDEVMLFSRVLTDDEIATLAAVTPETASIFGSRGALREVEGDFPMGAPFGIPRRLYSDVANTRVEYFRLGKDLDENQAELSDRFMKYIEFYAQGRALEKDGPGQDMKLAQHFMGRFAEGVERMVKRLSENKRSRVSAIGSPGKGPQRPALARLPYRYGRAIRRGY